MIDVSELMDDPDFSAPYTVIRRTGAWDAGRYQVQEKMLAYYGPVQPPSSRELELLPEGERAGGVMCFWSKLPIYLSAGPEGESAVSDEILWQGRRYKVIQLNDWSHGGWVQAYAALL